MDLTPQPHHTVSSFDDEMNQLHAQIMEMGGLAKKQIQKAIASIKKEDLDLAKKVLKRENKVNNFELNVDASVNRIIALRQPMASDLRHIMAISKCVNDLERVGDEARKIAKITAKFYGGDSTPPNPSLLRDIDNMSKYAQGTLSDALEALSRWDMDSALAIAKSDEELNLAFSDALRRLATYMMEDSRNIGYAIDVVFLIKAIERVGDHARNIAEYIVYAVSGQDIRHMDSEEAHESVADVQNYNSYK